jgi:hypothetical protein
MISKNIYHALAMLSFIGGLIATLTMTQPAYISCVKIAQNATVLTLNWSAMAMVTNACYIQAYKIGQGFTIIFVCGMLMEVVLITKNIYLRRKTK